MMPVAQQESGQLLASLTQGARRRQTGSHEIADRLMRLIGNPDRGQFTGSVQLGEVERIPPISFESAHRAYAGSTTERPHRPRAVRRHPRGWERSIGRGLHRPAIERVLQQHAEGEFEMNN
jgi:hypothetical protein